MRIHVVVSSVAFLALSLTACQKPPTQELTGAESLLENAEKAEAATYAGEQLESAREALASAKAEIGKQNEKLALFRNYKEAGKLVAEARSLAEQAEAGAQDGKERARQQAGNAYTEIEESLAEAETLLAELATCALKPKGFAADLELMQGRIDGLSSEAGMIESEIEAERYLGAHERAGALMDQIHPLITDMQAVKTKVRC